MLIKQATFAGSSQHTDQKPKVRHPEFAFIGRSNVGKSSLINRLCGVNGLAHTSSTPGKTRLVNHFLINGAWYLVDLPGYGYARMGKKGREKLQEIISDYILHSEEMVLLFVLLDARHELQQIDRDFITELGAEGIPFALIYTKCDKLGVNALKAQVEHNAEILRETWEELPPTFCSSAETGQGTEAILDYIGSTLDQL